MPSTTTILMYKQGLILGKFSPFHLGHAYLIAQARAQCERLCVMVTSEKNDAIPGWQRYHWVKSHFPELDVRHLIGAHQPSTERLKANFPDGIAVVFESGDKQESLAASLNAAHQAIDPERKSFPVSTAEILDNPQQYNDLLPAEVRAFFLKRIALVGPESCGKSYLAEHLAAHFKTAFVAEYGRTYCEKFGMDSVPLDFSHVAGGQLFHEDEMALKADKVLFCDTDLIVTQIWSEVYFQGKCQSWIYWADHERRYDLFLLCTPDIPWVNDGLREFENQREWMFNRLKEELTARGLPYVIIRGDFESRTTMAIEAVESILVNGMGSSVL